MKGIYNVQDFGAVGDGHRKDTAALQSTIDKCSEDGGGQVLVPPGIFLTGTLELKDNTELYLMQGAKLLASPDPKDYTNKYNAPYDTGFPEEDVTSMHLLIGWKKENITICGHGIIDGNSQAFLGPATIDSGSFRDWKWEYANRWRPGQMVALLECRAIRIEGITLQNSPYWTIWPYACRDVMINNIKIRNDWKTQNGDGIDPDCCENVIISNCDISAGDDAIALRADSARSGLMRNLENVVITNCIINTPLGGVRFGPSGEKSSIRNVSVSNCVIKNAGKGILFSQWHGWGWDKGVLIENVRISNMIINAQAPLRMYVQGDCGAPCGFRNIYINNITASGTDACCMIGNNDCIFENIHISDFRLSLSRLSEAPGGAITKQGMGNAFYVKNIKDIDMKNVTIDVSNETLSGLVNVIYFEGIKKLIIDNLEIVPGKNRKERIVFKNIGAVKKLHCNILEENFITSIIEK